MKTTCKTFGVSIPRADGSFFLASSMDAAPKLFFTRGLAVKHKKELIAEGFKGSKVVPVEMICIFQDLSSSAKSAVKNL